MKNQLLFMCLAVVVTLFANGTSAEEKRKHYRRLKTTVATKQNDSINILGTNDTGKSDYTFLVPQEDPCINKHCGAGRICQVTEKKAKCACIEKCDGEGDPRRRVCTNYNETFGSDCEVYQARCFCDSDDTRCRGPEYQHVHIEYYGECKQMSACKEEDRLDFPRRMRDWLFNVMRDLADRQQLSGYYLKMQREAESNHTLRWSNAAIWKWCDLDGYPHDRAVSRHELFPIRAPLMTLEHCIAPFLDSCDTDSDHKITLLEWGSCLELEQEELEEQCDFLVDVHGGDNK